MNNPQQQPEQGATAGEPLGLRLRHAREAMGLSLADAGERLRLPVAIIEAMERDDHERLGATVFARGHLSGYARLLGVPQVLVESALAPTPPPPLKTTVRVTRSHYLFDRYARRAVYVVLTASIVLPVVWLATRDQLPGGATVVETLDSAQDVPEAGTAARPLELPTDAAQPPPQQDPYADRPVVASMAPFYREQQPAPAPPAVPPASAEHLEIAFEGPSWVEVVARDGRRLAFGLVAAGEERRFEVAEIASVSIGDADAVEVTVAGESMDLAPFRRAKVARFTLSSDGEPKPAGG